MNDKPLKKGDFVVEPSFEISEFVEKLNKLSYKQFPVDEVLQVLIKHELSQEVLEPYIFFSHARYTRNLIYKAPEFELLVLCWKQGQQSLPHGHENQKCWMRIEQGELEFINFQEEPSDSRLLRKMESKIGKKGFVDGPAIIHQVSNVSEQDAISLHLYARPFSECDVYELKTSQKFKSSLGYHSIQGKLVIS